MVDREPEWVASRIQLAEQLEQENKELRAHVEQPEHGHI